MIKGMIFAAGYGSRLRPITDSIPKALVDVGGRPMLRRVIDKLIAAGVGEIVVNVHHFADMIEEYVSEISAEIGARIIISDERLRLLDTGGGLCAAERYLADADAIVVHNADILSDSSIDMMLAYHTYLGGLGTLMVDPQRESTRKLLFDKDLRLRGRINLTTSSTTPSDLHTDEFEPAAFSGIHVISPEIFGPLKKYAALMGQDSFSITDFYAECCDSVALYGYVAERPSMWYDIGKPASLAEARSSFTPQA